MNKEKKKNRIIEVDLEKALNKQYQLGVEAGDIKLRTEILKWIIKRSKEVLSYDELELLKEFNKIIKKNEKSR